MAKPKQLSNPFSSGGGGVAFENQVQTIFVVLMLTGGIVPCLPPWPIKKIKLQGRNQDYNTDDFIAFTEERSTGRKAKLLAQIKHRISFTENDSTLAEAIQAAWLDFNNTRLFDPTIDAIAVLSGPLTSDDVENVRTILEWARHYATALEFVENIQMGNFSSEGKRKINLDQREIVLRQEPTKIIEQIEATLHLSALETESLDVGQIKVLQLASGKTPLITNERRLLKAKH